MRWGPRTLFGRVALIVCGGLALAHVLTFFIILRERGDQGLDMMLAYLGRDVAASVAILDRVPPAERAAWLPRLARQNYRYTLGEGAPGPLADNGLAAPLASVVAAALGPARVGAMHQDPQAMRLPLRLADGQALSLVLTPPRPMVSRTTLLLLALQLGALGAAAWLGVRLAVRPLGRMAEAADALTPGQDSHRPTLDEAGPREVVQAARAFNAMQARIDGHLAERMQLLAAISHDLQTPITRMRLRTELIPDEPLRGKLQADLQGMQALVEEGLAYARTAHAAQEAPQAIDLDALLDGLVCDALDAGQRVELIGRCGTPVRTRMLALRRIVTNLLDNAFKFGGEGPAQGAQAVQLAVEPGDGEVHITVLDRGPGIPADQLQAVLEPFVRLETSRNRETGGTGLGLAIAHQLSLALPGRLVLSNRPGGGLQARLSFTPAWFPPGQTGRPADRCTERSSCHPAPGAAH